MASASGKDHVSLLEVSKMTAEFTLPNRSVRRTRQRPAKEIITSRCPTILAATPASIGGISPSRTLLPSCLYVSPVASSSSSSPVQIRGSPAPSQYWKNHRHSHFHSHSRSFLPAPTPNRNMFFDCTRAAFRKKMTKKKLVQKHKRGQKRSLKTEKVWKKGAFQLPTNSPQKKNEKKRKFLLYFRGGEFSPFWGIVFKSKGIFCRKFPFFGKINRHF